MRTRRHTSSAGLEILRAASWRRFARDLAIIGVVAALGFGLSSSWINPGPIIEDDHPVPRVVEMPEDEAKKSLAQAGFRARVEGEWPIPAIPRGTVAWQDPPPDMVLPANTTVNLVLSAGPGPVAVPDVVGLSGPFAERIIEAAGIRVGKVDTVRAAAEAGVVIATRPGTGQGRPRGSPVDLVISGGPAPAGVP